MARGGTTSRRRFRVLPTVLLTVAIFAVPTVVYAWGRSSPAFSVDRVTVTGTHVVSQPRVLRLLRHTYLGRNLFTITSREVRQTLSPLCYVETARIDRAFPHTLKVTVVEHRPSAYVLAGDRWYVVADDAEVICSAGRAAQPAGGAGASGATTPTDSATVAPPPTSPSPAAGLASSPAASPGATSEGGTTAAADAAASGSRPGNSDSAAAVAARLALIFTGPGRAPFRLPSMKTASAPTPGKVLDDGRVRLGLAVSEGLPGNIRGRVAAIDVARSGNLTLLFRDGLTVKWGDSRRSLAKTLALGVVLKRYASAGQVPTSIDVSVPDRVLALPVLK